MIADNKVMSVDYEDYENLADFPKEFDMQDFFKGVKIILEDEMQWLAQFQSMNDLRRFQKFNGESSYSLLKDCFPSIIKLCSSLRSNLSKLALITTREFFILQKYHHHEFAMIKKIIVAVLVQSATTKIFIKEEALTCLGEIVSNESFCNLEIVSILLEEMSNKNLIISENACATSEKILKKITFINFTSHLKENYLCNVLVQIVNLYLLKKDNFSKKAVRTFELVCNITGKDELNNFLNHSSVKNLKNTLDEIHKVILSKTKSKSQNGSIKDVIKQKINKGDI